MERSFYKLPELAKIFDMSLGGLRNAILYDRFPVPTYKIGKHRVADKFVVEKFFEEQRNIGLSSLSTVSGVNNFE